ncbi:hypothetical protein G6F64_014967 [Rhizopus arrhizus]|uniref:Uncharacterized protein n=1 Tax=Rhizopus oryzae TaxID=64495 RepID=A0A9P6WSF7_RHIOR|nr:hypothetical protein G6F64_014967 [Rhizopus arrhizus]
MMPSNVRLRVKPKNAQGTQQSFLVLSSENSDEDGYNSEVEGNYAAEKRNLSSSQSELDRKTRSGKRLHNSRRFLVKLRNLFQWKE